jgi:DNA helicase-2/ATP-dependent DNA helicase PcrA
MNALSRAFEFAMREHGIPYQMVNGLEFFQRKEIKDVLAYLHLLGNPQDEVALLRVINTPPRGIGKTTLDRLVDYAIRNGLPLLEAARRAKRIESLGMRPAAMLVKFVALFDRLAAAVVGPIEEVLGLVLSETGYQQQLRESEDEDDQQRLANIEELLTVARDFDERRGEAGQLEAFLEETSLVSDTDAWETDADRVTLMTLHASKGLEFPVVFLTAVEEGILPHERSKEYADQLEEERRLMFVGITRARQELQLSTARYRDFRGQRKLTIPSSFLMELPRGEMDMEFGGLNVPPRETWQDVDSSNFIDENGDFDQEHRLQLRNDVYEPVCAESGDELRAEPRDDIQDECTSVESLLAKQATEEKTSALHSLRSLRLTTAAAMAGGESSTPASPDVFRQGMVVLHAAYGLGQIIALSGSGAARKATVDFPEPVGRKKFLLAEASLQPVGGTGL